VPIPDLLGRSNGKISSAKYNDNAAKAKVFVNLTKSAK